MNWKFQIGDMVSSKSLVAESRQMGKIEKKLTWFSTMRIIERMSIECCGGTQLFYTCEVNGKAIRYAEDSLVAANEYYDAMLEISMDLLPKQEV